MDYLKRPTPQPDAVTQEVHATVSEMLLAVEKEGIAAVRRYSERLDGWNPPSFRVSAEQIVQAEATVDPVLKGHIQFAQKQVRIFAQLQKDTLTEFAHETLPGVV